MGGSGAPLSLVSGTRVIDAVILEHPAPSLGLGASSLPLGYAGERVLSTLRNRLRDAGRSPPVSTQNGSLFKAKHSPDRARCDYFVPVTAVEHLLMTRCILGGHRNFRIRSSYGQEQAARYRAWELLFVRKFPPSPQSLESSLVAIGEGTLGRPGEKITRLSLVPLRIILRRAF